MKMTTTEANSIQAEVNKIWDKYDSNKDGTLSKKESKKFLTEMYGNMGITINNNEYDDLIAAYDQNGDGSITKNEVVVYTYQFLNRDKKEESSTDKF